MPGDIRSSGISNYNSVSNYSYTLQTQRNATQNIYLLKDLSYSFWEELYIPGMPKTRDADYENQYIFCTSQCLQGLCITDELVFITSDSEEQECMGELLVFDRLTGEYLVTFALDEESHLGGITWDGENIWICNSANNSIERIDYDFILKVASWKLQQIVNITNLLEMHEVKNPPSSVTYYNGSLWVVTHTVWTNSQMISYHYNDASSELELLNTYHIPEKVQGIAFDSGGEVFLSISYGRRNSSFIKHYESVYVMDYNVKDYKTLIEMPPCSEGIDILDEKIYVLFESAGEKFLEGTDGLGRSISPIDKILIIQMQDAEK